MISFLHTPTPGPRTPTIERALTAEDMAAAFGSSTKTIQALCRNKKIPGAFKTRLGWRIAASKWAEFLTGVQTGEFVSTRKAQS
jgi:hypothetical protein